MAAHGNGRRAFAGTLISAFLAFAPPASAAGAGSGPQQVVEAYYAAIDRGDFRAAYALWDDAGRASHQSFDAFAQGFAGTAHVSATVQPAGEIEGAAGSLFATVPVRIESELKDGTVQHFAGHYVLRRVNDVPGATPEQLDWHLYSAEIAAEE